MDNETLKEQLIGAWDLISQYIMYPDGRKVESRGENPIGILMYDANGNMSVQLMRNEEPMLQHTDLTQLDTAMNEYHAYFGTYEVDEEQQIVYHIIEGAMYPPYRGTKQIRHFVLDGDMLYLKNLNTGDETKREIVWRRR